MKNALMLSVILEIMINAINDESVWKYNPDQDLGPKKTIPVEVLCDPSISAIAKAIWLYIHSKPKSYHFASIRIQKDFKESRRSILNAINQLEEHGYLKKKRTKNRRMSYDIYREPFSMNEEDAKELLLEVFPKAAFPAIKGDGVTHSDAIKAFEREGFDYEEANKLGFEYVDLCEQSETPMVKETLNVWVEHHLPIKTKSQVS
jgi:hypothetical protein